MDSSIFLIIASYIVVYSLGFIVGKFSAPQMMQAMQAQNTINASSEKPTSFLSKANTETKQEKNRKIEIDDRKFITDIKTDSLEKKFDELGNKMVTKDENLSANINKLASLKKNKEG